MVRRAAAFSIICLVAVSGLVAASAATLGPVQASLFATGGPVTNTVDTRSIADLTLSTAGGPATVSAMTITVVGGQLDQLDGQELTVVVLDSAGTLVNETTVTLTSGAGLTIGATSASVVVPVAAAPLASTYDSWAVFIAGVQALGPVSESTDRVVTVGSGTFTVTPVDWKDNLVPEWGPGVDVTNVVMVTATTVTQCVAITVTGTAVTPTPWTVEVHYSEPPFYGVLPVVDGRAVVLSSAGGILNLRGTSNGNALFNEWANNSLLAQGQSLTFTVCLYSAPAAPDRPEAYTVSAQSRGVWNNNRACTRRTVTGNGTYPFYFGWSVTLDVTEAIARLQSFDAGAPRSLRFQPNTVTPAFGPLVTSYVLTNIRNQAVSGTGSTVVELCLSRN